MPYTGNPGTVPRDAVRLRIGDTQTPELLDDASIDYLLAQAAGSVELAAALAAEALAARFSGGADSYTAGRVSKSYAQRAAAYWTLAKTIRAGLARFVAPVSTGQLRDVDVTDARNAALKQPQFTIGQHDNPAAEGGGILGDEE